MRVEDRIEKEMRRDPLTHPKLIAMRAKVSLRTVYDIGHKIGLASPKRGRWKRYWLDEANAEWIRDGADEMGVSPRDFVNAVITDARVENAEPIVVVERSKANHMIRRARARSMLLAGHPTGAVAHFVGLTRDEVEQVKARLDNPEGEQDV